MDDGSAISLQFGGPGDRPLPGDYLGLGRAQIAVYRPTSGEWFVRTDTGSTQRLPWGGPADLPFPAPLALGR